MLGTKLEHEDAREEVEDDSYTHEKDSEEESNDEDGEEDSYVLTHQSPCTSGSSTPHNNSPLKSQEEEMRDSPVSQVSLQSIMSNSVSVTATSSSSSSSEEDEVPEESLEKKVEDETEDSNETMEQVPVGCDQTSFHSTTAPPAPVGCDQTAVTHAAHTEDHLILSHSHKPRESPTELTKRCDLKINEVDN